MEKFEQETIISFNKEDKSAYVFTYEATWQTHFEKKLKIKPFMDNGYGGKEYIIDKTRIKMPHAPRKSKLSKEQRTAVGKRLAAVNRRP